MEQVGEATAGGVAGAFSLACLYPLVVAKTRLQAQRRAKEGAEGEQHEAYENAVDCLIKVARHEGLRGLFKGLSSSLPRAFMTNFVFYFFFATLKPLFRRWKGMLGNMVHGVCAGIGVQLVMVPFEMVNTRVIADRTGKTRFVRTFRAILAEKGVMGLYQGIAPALVLTLNPGITNVVRQFLTPSDAAASNSKNFWSGAASKACASLCTYPYVLAKVQMFTHKRKSTAPSTPSEGSGAAAQDREGEEPAAGAAGAAANGDDELTIAGVLGRVIREDGVLGMYKGCEMQVGLAVLKEALLNTARHPLRTAIMSLFVGPEAASQ